MVAAECRGGEAAAVRAGSLATRPTIEAGEKVLATVAVVEVVVIEEIAIVRAVLRCGDEADLFRLSTVCENKSSIRGGL